MHVTEQTARSYLKQIFVKTETNRQAELVRLMLTSSVRTAPHSRASFV
jgi:DNA-binding CsgD family transcriptional regulator